MSASSSTSSSNSGPIPSSSTVQIAREEVRPQAGPLPSKRGELGFVEGVHTPTGVRFYESSESVAPPARHPADRDHIFSHTPASSGVEAGTLSPSSSSNPAPPSSSDPIAKPKRLFGFLKPKGTATCGGINLITLSLFTIQFVVFVGTIVGWVFAAKLVAIATSGPSVVLLHVVLAVATIIQFIFLERRIYRLRGERYTYLHPGEVLPRFRTNSPGLDSATIAFAPWHRPPLPTYAATLAESGVGTGDVEDNIIAAPPPPAYGITRGSTLLLAGYLTATMRAERPRSEHSQLDSRPVSYASRDGHFHGDQVADRSVRLEETLNRLESTSSSTAATC
ncbi:hypothetical protein CPB83DRAFT_845775 [Crepidotus variabilis]|uniref:Uncharacterized protein n=1 Tax=Crepidotus variabilis TaxID=179855 RepID=A0A9P6JV27_9AGAR|nr:hypothetical protein CPB83DRAFT_845775 [Crepidotus variabilis]